MPRLLALHALVALAVVVVACGGLAPVGGNGTPSSGADGTPSAGGNAGATGLSQPCSLLTEAEVAGGSHLLDTDLPLTATSTAGDPATCEYTFSDKTPILKLSAQKNGAANTFQSRSQDQGDAASGIGDQARYLGDGHLLFLTGEYFVDLDAHYAGDYYSHGDYYQTGTDLDKTILLAKIIESRLRTGSVPAALEITAPPKLQAHSACDLLSADEARAILAKGALAATANESTPNFCYYTTVSDGMSVFTVYYRPYDGAKFYADEEGTLTAEPVSGVGDKAMYESFSQALHVLQGDSEIVVTVTDFNVSPDDAKALAQQLATKMLSHL